MSLKEAARVAFENAYAPYSKFRVGAALRGASGQIYAGCNVENASYPEGTCAEAGALAAMVVAGETRFVEAFVLGDCPEPLTPCGGCRQRLAEFAGADAVVTMANIAGATREARMSELLPGAFTDKDMEGV